MTTARELHDNWIDITDTNRALMAGDPENGETILRALDLLARVEEEKDDIVIELRFDAKDLRRWGRVDHAETLDNAAAALVALKAERESMKEQFESLIAQGQAKMDALKAERDKFRGHAEAMATELNGYIGLAHPALDAYRRDFPKDAP